MSVRSRYGAAALLLALAGLLNGCGQKPAVTGGDGNPQEPASTEPAEIELFDAQASFTEPNLVRFEVRYRFTKGKPSKYYMCDISFPGTANHGAKEMNSWELNSEGVIKDGIVLTKPPVQSFEIRVSEADSPQNGYKKISNVIGGTVK